MTSKRSVDRRLSDLERDGDDSEDIPYDVRHGVTAPFVTYDHPDSEGGVGPEAVFITYGESVDRQEPEDSDQ